MEKVIYFDMDNTLNDFYRGDWLERILAQDTKPYDIAPCVIPEYILYSFIQKGYKLSIISWLAKGATKEYNARVRQAKKEWLKRNYPNIKFEEIHIVKYGTPKWSVAKIKNSYLFDDEKPNRDAWQGVAINPIYIKTLARA